MPSHYLYQCWLFVNWIFRNKFQWNIDGNSNILIQENAFGNDVGKNGVNFVQASMCYCWLSLSNTLGRTQIARFMGPTWGPPGPCWPQMGPILAPWTLLSGYVCWKQPGHWSLLGFVRTRVLMSRSRLNNGATHGGWHFDIHRDFDTRGR